MRFGRAGIEAPVVPETPIVSSVVSSVMDGHAIRAHDYRPGFAPQLAPASTPPSPASGGLGGQSGIGIMGPLSRTLPSAPTPSEQDVQMAYDHGHHERDRDVQLLNQVSYPVAWQGQRYWAAQSEGAKYADIHGTGDPELNGRALISDIEFNVDGIPTRIPRLFKRYLSAWQGVGQWGYPQWNHRLNMRPGIGQLARQPSRGTRSVSGVQDVLVQGSGTRRIPSVFVPPSIY